MMPMRSHMPPMDADTTTSTAQHRHRRYRLGAVKDHTKKRACRPRRFISSSQAPGSPDFGAVALCGGRKSMEDALTVMPQFTEDLDFFGVYDGHNGSEAAAMCSQRLHCILSEELASCSSSVERLDKESMWQKVMRDSFLKMDSEIIGEFTSGAETPATTATVVVVGMRDIVVANCGDSRAVLFRNGKAVPLSVDHKPEREDETARIEAAGGKVIWWNGHRVLGVLATSRSIGEKFLKPFVIPDPDVRIEGLKANDEFLIVATDGLWNVVSNEKACEVVKECLQKKRRTGGVGNVNGNGRSRAALAAALLSKLAFSCGSSDNTTVLVVDLRSLSRP